MMAEVVVKHAGGRPPKYSIVELVKEFREYVDSNDDPITVGFCAEYGISSSRFYDYVKDSEELSDILKRATDKQEAYLIRNAQNNKINPIFSMFRLKQKQFGWSDKQEIEVSGANGGPLLTQNIVALADSDLKQLLEIMERSQIQGEIVDIKKEEG